MTPLARRATLLLIAALAQGWLATARAAVAEAGYNSPWFARVWQSEDGLPGTMSRAWRKRARLSVDQQPEWAGAVRRRAVRADSFAAGGGAQSAVDPGIAAGAQQSGDGWRWKGPYVMSVTSGTPTSSPPSMVYPISVRWRLCRMGDQAVWMGYVDGSACRIAEGRVTRFTARDGLAGRGSMLAGEDTNGQVWFAKAGRVGVFREGEFTTLRCWRTNVCESRGGGPAASGFAPGGSCRSMRKAEDLWARGNTAPRAGMAWSQRPCLRPGTRHSGSALGQGLFRYDGTNCHEVPTSHGDIECLTDDREAISGWARAAAG